MGVKKAVCASITVNTLSSHLRAEDAELRMELRLPALQQKIINQRNQEIDAARNAIDRRRRRHRRGRGPRPYALS